MTIPTTGKKVRPHYIKTYVRGAERKFPGVCTHGDVRKRMEMVMSSGGSGGVMRDIG